LLSIKEFSRASDSPLSLSMSITDARAGSVSGSTRSGFYYIFFHLPCGGRQTFLHYPSARWWSRRASESSCFSWCCLSLSSLFVCASRVYTHYFIFIYIMNERDFIPPDASYIYMGKKSRSAFTKYIYRPHLADAIERRTGACTMARVHNCFHLLGCWLHEASYVDDFCRAHTASRLSVCSRTPAVERGIGDLNACSSNKSIPRFDTRMVQQTGKEDAFITLLWILCPYHFFSI
jgi:hypothetical protein